MLGEGIGDLTGKGLRIAHMGHVNAPMMLGTLGVVETALGALGIAHGRGCAQAAINFLTEAVPAAEKAPGRAAGQPSATGDRGPASAGLRNRATPRVTAEYHPDAAAVEAHPRLPQVYRGHASDREKRCD